MNDILVITNQLWIYNSGVFVLQWIEGLPVCCWWLMFTHFSQEGEVSLMLFVFFLKLPSVCEDVDVEGFPSPV